MYNFLFFRAVPMWSTMDPSSTTMKRKRPLVRGSSITPRDEDNEAINYTCMGV
jgi:hypothetical protein